LPGYLLEQLLVEKKKGKKSQLTSTLNALGRQRRPKDQNGVILLSSEDQEQLASATRPLPSVKWPL
jgi:hypothetical protein